MKEGQPYSWQLQVTYLLQATFVFQMSLWLFYWQLLFITEKEFHVGDHKSASRGSGARKLNLKKANSVVIANVCYLCGFSWVLFPTQELLPVLQMMYLNRWGPFSF